KETEEAEVGLSHFPEPAANGEAEAPRETAPEPEADGESKNQPKKIRVNLWASNPEVLAQQLETVEDPEGRDFLLKVTEAFLGKQVNIVRGFIEVLMTFNDEDLAVVRKALDALRLSEEPEERVSLRDLRDAAVLQVLQEAGDGLKQGEVVRRVVDLHPGRPGFSHEAVRHAILRLERDGKIHRAEDGTYGLAEGE